MQIVFVVRASATEIQKTKAKNASFLSFRSSIYLEFDPSSG